MGSCHSVLRIESTSSRAPRYRWGTIQTLDKDAKKKKKKKKSEESIYDRQASSMLWQCLGLSFVIRRFVLEISEFILPLYIINPSELPLFSLLFVCYEIYLSLSRRSKQETQQAVMVSDPSTTAD